MVLGSSNFILLHMAVQFSQVSFLHCIVLPPLSSINWPQVHGFISGLYILSHLSIILSLCHYHTVLMTVAFQYNNVMECDYLLFYSFFSRLFQLFRIFFGSIYILGLFALVLQKISLYFGRNCIKSVLKLQDGHKKTSQNPREFSICFLPIFPKTSGCVCSLQK